jgi:hypothetical protein
MKSEKEDEGRNEVETGNENNRVHNGFNENRAGTPTTVRVGSQLGSRCWPNLDESLHSHIPTVAMSERWMELRVRTGFLELVFDALQFISGNLSVPEMYDDRHEA